MFQRGSIKLASSIAMLGLIAGSEPVLWAAQNDGDLKVIILKGDGFTNNLKKRVSTTPVVEVRDRNNKPVAGASVAFTLPANGPSAAFTNGSRLMTVVTGPNGQATAGVMKANSLTGTFQVNVAASYQGQVATVGITQTNVPAVAGGALGLGTTAFVGIVGGAAAAVATVVAVKVSDGGKKAKVGVGTPTIQ
jgi:hypothetical protein